MIYRWLLTLCVMLMVQTVPSSIPSALAQQGSKFFDLPDVNVGVTPILIRAANSARLALTCTNNDVSSPIRIGGATVSATRGMRLGPGGTMVNTSTADIFGFSEVSTVVLSCSEEIR